MHLRNVDGGYGLVVAPRHVAIRTFRYVSDRSWSIVPSDKGGGKGTTVLVACTMKEGNIGIGMLIFTRARRFQDCGAVIDALNNEMMKIL